MVLFKKEIEQVKKDLEIANAKGKNDKKNTKEMRKKNELKTERGLIKIRKALQRAPMKFLEKREKIEDTSLLYSTNDKVEELDDEDEERIEEQKAKSIAKIASFNVDENIPPATVAAFLRVIYASIRYSPNEECRRKSLDHIIELDIFKKVTTLCYKAQWMTGNIGLKYLRIVRNVIEKDQFIELSGLHKDTKATLKAKKKGKYNNLVYYREKLYFFEIISNSIQEILGCVTSNFSKKKTKSYLECEEEIYLLSEITKCCKLMVEKISRIQFHVDDEKTSFGDAFSYGASKPRTIQEKCVSFVISRLVTKDVVKTLLKLKTTNYVNVDSENVTVGLGHSYPMSFKDLPKKNKELEIQNDFFTSKDDDEEEETKGQEYDNPQTEFEAKIYENSGDNVSKTIRDIINENVSFVENLKELLGQYLSKCLDSQYEIIETIMRMEVFEGKGDATKFLLEANQHKNVEKGIQKLETYMRKKGMFLSDGEVHDENTTPGETVTPTGTHKHKKSRGEERIVFKENCNAIISDGAPLEKRILVVTNYGIYIMVSPIRNKSGYFEGEPNMEYSWDFLQIKKCKIENDHNRVPSYLVVEVPKMKGFFDKIFGFFSRDTSTPTGSTATGTETATGNALTLHETNIDSVLIKFDQELKEGENAKLNMFHDSKTKCEKVKSMYKRAKKIAY